MKFALNAAMTIGTYDGANIEIYNAVGADNFYLFGLTEEQIRSRRLTYNPHEIYERSEYVKRILNAINSTMFADANYPQLFRPIFDSLLNNDYYFILADLEAFNKAIQKASKDFADKDTWAKKALMNVARIGYFSSDRSVMEYAHNIWHVEPVEDDSEE
jgi:starch phosphorylase